MTSRQSAGALDLLFSCHIVALYSIKEQRPVGLKAIRTLKFFIRDRMPAHLNLHLFLLGRLLALELAGEPVLHHRAEPDDVSAEFAASNADLYRKPKLIPDCILDRILWSTIHECDVRSRSPVSESFFFSGNTYSCFIYQLWLTVLKRSCSRYRGFFGQRQSPALPVQGTSLRP